MASSRCAVDLATPSLPATSDTVSPPSSCSMAARRRAWSTLAMAYGGGVLSGLSGMAPW